MNVYSEFLLESFKNIENIEKKSLKNEELTSNDKDKLKKDLENLKKDINKLEASDFSGEEYNNQTKAYFDKLINNGKELVKILPKASQERVQVKNIIEKAHSKVIKLKKKIAQREKKVERPKLVFDGKRAAYYDKTLNQDTPIQYVNKDKLEIKACKRRIRNENPDSKGIINKMDADLVIAMEYLENSLPEILEGYIKAVKSGKKEDMPFDLEYDMKNLSGLSFKEKVHYMKMAWNHRKIATVIWPEKTFKRTKQNIDIATQYKKIDQNYTKAELMEEEERLKIVFEAKRRAYYDKTSNQDTPIQYLEMNKREMKACKKRIKNAIQKSRGIINKIDTDVVIAMECLDEFRPEILQGYIKALKSGKKEDMPFDLEYDMIDMSRLRFKEKIHYIKSAWNNRKVATVKWPKNKYKNLIAGAMALGVAIGGIGYTIKDKVKDLINSKNEITDIYIPKNTLNVTNNKARAVISEDKSNKINKDEIEQVKESICLGDTVNLKNGIEYFERVDKNAKKGIIGEKECIQAGKCEINGVAVTYGDEILDSIYQENLGMSIEEYKEKIARENGISLEDLNVHIHIGDAGWMKEEKDLDVIQKYNEDNKDNKFKESLQCDINQTPRQDDISKPSVSSIDLER